MAAKKRRSYTRARAQRAAVLADVKVVGVSEAARKHAMPRRR